MAVMEAQGIIEQIQSIVSDQLQVVSYKWLSRNFLVSSNCAKRLLEQFVEKYGNELEVIYSLSGWLKNNPSTYHIQLVPRNKISDAKQQFGGSCSIQIYSVQSCLPKDPATLWNHEFSQAEFLFKEPSAVDNCLWDNRFCGVSNSYVQRIAGDTRMGSGALQMKTSGASGSSKSISSHQAAADGHPLQKKLQSSDYVKPVKSETMKHELEKTPKLAACKGKAQNLPLKSKNAHVNKTSAGTGDALASIWERTSAKSTSDALLHQANTSRKNCSASAEAQICARESGGYESSDEETRNFNIKRTSVDEPTRKRRFMLDYSDEEDDHENAISLASPDTRRSPLSSDKNSKKPDLECNILSDMNENQHEVKQVEESGTTEQQFQEKLLDSSNETSKNNHIDAVLHDKITDPGTKRRKTLKTRIDERGREVTEVVWEGEELVTKSENTSAKVVDNSTVNNGTTRPPLPRKSPAVGNAAPANQVKKAGNKKVVGKDPKQGNILNFFKKA